MQLRSSPRNRRAHIALLTLGLLAAPTLASCGSDPRAAADEVAAIDSNGADTSTTTPADGSAAPTDPREAMLAFTECMRDHGIDMPDPQVASSGEGGPAVVSSAEGPGSGPGTEFDPQSEAFQAAQKDCQHFMDDARGDIDIDPAQVAEQQQQMLDNAQCMRDHGIVNFPDPTFGENGSVTMTLDPSVDPNSDEFKAAEEACRHLIFGDDAPPPIGAVGSAGSGPVTRAAGGGQ
jgi:hypothetical protein